MTLSEIRNWLKTLTGVDANHIFIGRLENKKTNSIGVYNLTPIEKREVFNDLQMYTVKRISILIHGSTSKAKTEDFANDVYKKLNALKPIFFIGKKKVYFIELEQEEPVDVDIDDSKIYEYTIDFNLYIERG